MPDIPWLFQEAQRHHRAGRLNEAEQAYRQILAREPRQAHALHSFGVLASQTGNFDTAVELIGRAIAVQGEVAIYHNSLGVALYRQRKFDDALASADRAVAIRPGYADAFYTRGNILNRLQRPAEAAASYERALAIDPNHRYALNALANRALRICDWARTTKLKGVLERHVAEGKAVVTPFNFLGYSSDAALQLKCAKSYAQTILPVRPPAMWHDEQYRHRRIRLAYLAGDFHSHANPALELFERHDRTRFEVIGVSFGPDGNSDIRARASRSFDQFHDVRLRNDHDIAALLKQLEIDIAIDMTGYTNGTRCGILAHRPVPIQVNLLVYPGTLGVDFMDYIVGDKIVVPFDRQPFYMERIVQLPDCFQANDSTREISSLTPRRQEVGLPEQGFVFCSFTNSYKITPPVFAAWMWLLKSIAGSVLWLLHDNAAATANLRRQAAALGIEPSRLVFAPRLPPEQHLARHRLADLFLDTLPVNAGGSASDALWAGLPLLTCSGDSAVSRLGASQLNAIGLPVVTKSLDEYATLARKLATNPVLLRSIRRRLKANRLTHPLFDGDRYRRHLEAAYARMWEIWQRGEKPRSFAVPPYDRVKS
ncbi:MAG TPA: tetratricopeptide repeat protein [Stellaceae bacterium]|nr:tetratricopeptide repeat protein [Stellaceae bacterium]